MPLASQNGLSLQRSWWPLDRAGFKSFVIGLWRDLGGLGKESRPPLGTTQVECGAWVRDCLPLDAKIVKSFDKQLSIILRYVM